MQNEKAQTLKDGLAKLIQALATDTDEARQSTLFTSYLRACGMFHNYSWHNCALIWSQKPEATRVAGFQTWKKLGRYVLAGSKGIAIFAPMIFKDRSAAEENAEQESTHVWFRVVYVFDRLSRDLWPSRCAPDGFRLCHFRKSSTAASPSSLNFPSVCNAPSCRSPAVGIFRPPVLGV